MSAGMSYSEEKPQVTSDVASQMPQPTGFRLLIALAPVEEKTEGGIVIPEERRDLESDASIIGCVLKMGPDAYANKEKFPNGPYCEVGDWIIMKSYSGVRFGVHDVKFRLINDDTVQAVIEDPRGITRG